MVDAVPVLTAAGAGSRDDEVLDTSVLLLRSEEARTRGDYRECRRLAEEAATLATDDRDDRALAQALRLVCNQALRLGDLEDSARAGNDAVLVAERLGDRPGQVDALNLLSFAYLNLALVAEAIYKTNLCQSVCAGVAAAAAAEALAKASVAADAAIAPTASLVTANATATAPSTSTVATRSTRCHCSARTATV